MAEIEATIVVEPFDITIQPDQSNINITADPVTMTISTNSSSPGGINGELQYNDGGRFGGIAELTYNSGNVFVYSVGNLKIPGGSNAYFLQTDGTGNLTWAQGTANVSGNGTAAGANTQIQISDGTGNFTSAPGFTFDSNSNVCNMPGDLYVAGNLYANIIGNISNANYANYAGEAFSVTGSNVFGPVALANSANISSVANTVNNSSQPNITSLGNLTSLTVVGTTTIQQGKEKITINNTGSNGTINFDVLDQAIIYNSANATGNFTLNFRGNNTISLDSLMNNNESLTVRYINTNGNIGYYSNNIQIDGSNITPLWVVPLGAPSIGITSGKDIYDFEIIKTGSNTYLILGSKAGYQ